MAPAQEAASADRNAVNTAAVPGDMMADSPVTFPKEGALPAQYPPDVASRAEPAEADYYTRRRLSFFVMVLCHTRSDSCAEITSSETEMRRHPASRAENC